MEGARPLYGLFLFLCRADGHARGADLLSLFRVVQQKELDLAICEAQQNLDLIRDLGNVSKTPTAYCASILEFRSTMLFLFLYGVDNLCRPSNSRSFSSHPGRWKSKVGRRSIN